MSKKIVCVIPARLASTRFPEKVLACIDGRPMLQWVWEAAISCHQFHDVMFAVDAQKTMDLVLSFGAKALMTSPLCPSGTARLVEVWKRREIQADIWVNWQGDGPLIHEQMITDLLQNEDRGDIWTLKKKMNDQEDPSNPNVVKVVTNQEGSALYFSRAPIPFSRDDSHNHTHFYKHIGIYAYTDAALSKIAKVTPCHLELLEKLEQLSFLYHGLAIQVNETTFETIEVDLPEHIALVRQKLLLSSVL